MGRGGRHGGALRGEGGSWSAGAVSPSLGQPGRGALAALARCPSPPCCLPCCLLVCCHRALSYHSPCFPLLRRRSLIDAECADAAAFPPGSVFVSSDFCTEGQLMPMRCGKESGMAGAAAAHAAGLPLRVGAEGYIGCVPWPQPQRCTPLACPAAWRGRLQRQQRRRGSAMCCAGWRAMANCGGWIAQAKLRPSEATVLPARQPSID